MVGKINSYYDSKTFENVAHDTVHDILLIAIYILIQIRSGNNTDQVRYL